MRILITGGGSLNHFVEELAKDKLKLPAKKIGIKFDGESKFPVHDATWSIAYGLAMVGSESGEETGPSISGMFTKGSSNLTKIIRTISRLFKKILP